MSTVINVLLIDDDKDNYDSLKNKAARNHVLLHFKDNLKDGMKELKENMNLDAVILDGKAYLEPGQQRGTEKENFVHEALTQIRILENEQERVIPKCVLTAWYDQLKDSLDGRTCIYDKKKISLDEKLLTEMFNNLREDVNQAGVLNIRRKYADVFTAVSDILPNATTVTLNRILSLVEEGRIDQNDFNSIREVLEAFFVKANAIDKSLVPDDLIKQDGRPNLEWCYRYICGLQTDVRDGDILKISFPKKASIVPSHIGRSIDYVKQISSILSHNYPNRWTALSFKSAALALGEILIWFKEHVNNNYQNI
jgi:hypothetical protein